MHRILVICTHNSARSQMAEGWLRHHAQRMGLEAEIFSAGTEATSVKKEAFQVMKEVGISLEGHFSKCIDAIPELDNFDMVITVCAHAEESCPVLPAHTVRSHHSFRDPSGKDITVWRETRDAIGLMSARVIETMLLDMEMDAYF